MSFTPIERATLAAAAAMPGVEVPLLLTEGIPAAFHAVISRDEIVAVLERTRHRLLTNPDRLDAIKMTAHYATALVDHYLAKGDQL